MNSLLKYSLFNSSSRCFSTTSAKYDAMRCKLLVVGGGSGGCAIAARFARKLRADQVIVLDPADNHYYQPLFTLVGAGIKPLQDSYKPMDAVLPKRAKWLKDSAVTYKPESNEVVTKNNHTIKYDFMVVATGLELRYDLIPGLEKSLSSSDSGVCSIYSPTYAEDTWKKIRNIKSGNVFFTFPNSPVKCPGAPQKICYLAEDHFRKMGLRDGIEITYNTSLPVIFGCKKYADALWKVVNGRDIKVNTRTNLIEVKPDRKEAVFQNLDKPEEKTTVNYDLLHVTPPMSTSESLRTSSSLVNAAGFLTLNKETMQHTKFSNIFGIGDCTDTPNSKTAAAAAAQSPVVFLNLAKVMLSYKPTSKYDGYASCPLVTSYDKCILAEFDYNLTPKETFAFDQAVERKSMFYLKKDLLPAVYWTLMTKGYWNGPRLWRMLLNPLSS